MCVESKTFTVKGPEKVDLAEDSAVIRPGAKGTSSPANNVKKADKHKKFPPIPLHLYCIINRAKGTEITYRQVQK